MPNLLVVVLVTMPSALEPVALGSLDGWPAEHGSAAVAWSGDGGTIAVGGYQSVQLIDARTMRTVRSSTVRCPFAPQLSHDGAHLVCGGVLLDVKTGASTDRFEQPTVIARSLDGRMLVRAGHPALLERSDGTRVRLDTGDPPAKVSASDLDSRQRRDTRFSPDGRYLVVPGRAGLTLFATKTGAAIATVAHDFGFVNLTLGGGWLVIATPGSAVQIFALASGKLARRIEVPGLRSGAHAKLSLTPDGKTLAVVDSLATVLIDVATGEVRRSLPFLARHGGDGIAIAPDGKRFAIAASSAPLAVYDLDGNEQPVPQRHGGQVFSAMMSADGKRVATAARDGVRVFAVDGTLLHFAPGVVGHLHVSPDGTLVRAVGDSVATVREGPRGWSVTGAASARGSTTVRIVPDGRSAWIAAERSQFLERRDLESGAVLERLQVPRGGQDPSYAVDAGGALWIGQLDGATPTLRHGRGGSFTTLVLPQPPEPSAEGHRPRLVDMQAPRIAVSPSGARVAWLSSPGWLASTRGGAPVSIDGTTGVFLDNERLAVLVGDEVRVLGGNGAVLTRVTVPGASGLAAAAPSGDGVLVSNGRQLLVVPLPPG